MAHTVANYPQAYFFGIHLFGAICLVGWIHTANSKYSDVLAASAQDKTWWYVTHNLNDKCDKMS